MRIQQPSATTVASAWYIKAMEQLVSVIQDLSHARDLDAVMAIVREAARNLTGADGATFVLRDNDQCYYADESAIAPLWKGKRFPMSICISGWVMRNAQSVFIEDIYQDPRIPTVAYRPTFVKSLAMVPIRQKSPIGAIGNYWASNRKPMPEEMAILQALADTTSVALENVELYSKLQGQVQTLQAQQTRISEQHDKLETFTRALSHDLKEPVRTMMSFTRMLKEGQVDPTKRDTYFQHVQKAANRMGMLLDAVFQYTQLDATDPQTNLPCSLQHILGDAQANLAQLIKERQATVIGSDLPIVRAHPGQITHVLQNLIANAIDHNEDDVTIRIAAKELSDQWLISVKDDGIGIAPEHIEKIFQPFKRMSHKEGHAGLGLAICTKIIAANNGKIWGESVPGQGATFFFTLPNPTPAAATTTNAPLQKPMTILLVDDLEGDIELMRLALERAKVQCNILIARDGEEAHEILKKSLGTNKVDLMLLDINMPRMDGFELLSNIRQDNDLKDTDVIMCTGSVYEGDKQRAKELGALSYIIKPPSVDSFTGLFDDMPYTLFHRTESPHRMQAE